MPSSSPSFMLHLLALPPTSGPPEPFLGLNHSPASHPQSFIHVCKIQKTEKEITKAPSLTGMENLFILFLLGKALP